MKFELHTECKTTNARAGTITTDRGTIQTPIFMPVGTAGTVKGIHQRELKTDINAPIILGNTYHLYLRPGMETMEAASGLHKFIGWDRHILTDSGGYQVYSLEGNRKITEEGVKFASHIDGTKIFFTPEYVMDVQRTLGSDIMMAFDECAPYPCEYTYAKKSMEMTHRWLTRCVNRVAETKEKYGFKQVLFPIVQGSVYTDLRIQSAEFIASQDCYGNAIGGLSVGEPIEDMYSLTKLVCDILPKQKPRYLMGVGTPANLIECISRGVDMFDCVMPTRNGRNGMLFTQEGIINIKNAKWKNDFTPLNPIPMSFIDTDYTKAYLKHLIISDERLGSQIASLANLSFYLWLVREARKAILEENFPAWKEKTLEKITRRL
ncbi:MAG: tRNA guanosine(34) transglycosylase Tgt [Bacteroidetes bacterium]|nr:tRNA guanosine(34) transglycosylase Tgt [Bacteroidota bacterium]